MTDGGRRGQLAHLGRSQDRRVSTIKVAARNDPLSRQFVLRCNISQNRPRFRARADRVSHDRSSLTEASSPSSSKSAS